MIILYFQSGQNVGETVYSNPDSNYDNYCTVYQSLEKPTPGSTVYQNLNSDQEKLSGRTALKNESPKQSTFTKSKVWFSTSVESGFRHPT